MNALVIDRAGNDRYEADIISEGVSDIRSYGWLLDEGGDDVYVAREGAAAFGAVDEQARLRRAAPDDAVRLLPAAGVRSSLDLGGTDQYLRGRGPAAIPSPTRLRATIARGVASRRWGPGAGRNVAVARDAAHGRAGFLDAWPRRVAPKPPPPPAPPSAPEAKPAPPADPKVPK